MICQIVCCKSAYMFAIASRLANLQMHFITQPFNRAFTGYTKRQVRGKQLVRELPLFT